MCESTHIKAQDNLQEPGLFFSHVGVILKSLTPSYFGGRNSDLLSHLDGPRSAFYKGYSI